MMKTQKKPRPDQRQKTLRAFRVYLELVDTAEYLRKWMRGPLESFDLTMQGFRMLVTLYQNGPTTMAQAAKELRCTRQNLNVVVSRLERRGWAQRRMVGLPAVEQRLSRLAKTKRALPRRGRRIGVVALTAKGLKVVATVFPSHAKVIKALMRVLDGREQDHLVRLCEKLRAGDVMKFVSEIRLVEEWEEEKQPEPKKAGAASVVPAETKLSSAIREENEVQNEPDSPACDVRSGRRSSPGWRYADAASVAQAGAKLLTQESIREANEARREAEVEKVKEVEEAEEKPNEGREAPVDVITATAEPPVVSNRNRVREAPNMTRQSNKAARPSADDWQGAMLKDWTPRKPSNAARSDAVRPDREPSPSEQGSEIAARRSESVQAAEAIGPNEAMWKALNPGVRKPKPHKFARRYPPRSRR